MKYLLATAAILGCSSWALAAENPFYIGAAAGVGIAQTVDTVIQGGVVAGEFPAQGITTPTLAGLIAGYESGYRSLRWGIEVSANYDFERQCFGLDCPSERHPGWLLQQLGELGFRWNGLTVLGRFGLAERSNNLCAFDLPDLTRVCGSGWVMGADAGIKFKYMVDKHIDMFTTIDGINWRGYATSTPVYPAFQNAVVIKNEVVFKLGISIH